MAFSLRSVSRSSVPEACCFLSVRFQSGLPAVHAFEGPSVHAMVPQWCTFFNGLYMKAVLAYDCGADGVSIMASTIPHRSAGLGCFAMKISVSVGDQALLRGFGKF